MSAAKYQKQPDFKNSAASNPDKGNAQHWHLHHGTAQLFIVGSGTDAWLRCSEPDYSPGPCKGTDAENAIAQLALKIRRRKHPYDNVGEKAIAAALDQATRQYENTR